jgi:hypothetical protein
MWDSRWLSQNARPGWIELKERKSHGGILDQTERFEGNIELRVLLNGAERF